VRGDLQKILAGLVVAAAVLLAGCTTGPAQTGTAGSTVGGPAGTSWLLVSMLDGGGNLTEVSSQPPVTLEFRDASILDGSGGCNQYGASYGTEGQRINITGIVSTFRYCADTAVDDRESTYLGLLAKVRLYRIDGDSLRFFDAEGTGLLAFVSESDQLMTGSWVLDSMVSGTGVITPVLAGTEIDATFGSDGSLSGSSGCNLYFARYTTTGTSLTINLLATTRTSCTGPAGIMDQERSFLSVLSQVAGYDIEGDRLVLLDSSGNGILWFQPGPGS